MLQLTENKRKFNPWALPAWCVEHPAWPVFVLAGLVSLVLFPFTLGEVGAGGVVAAIACCFMWIVMVGIVLGKALYFFEDGGWYKIQRWFRNKRDNYGKVED